MKKLFIGAVLISMLVLCIKAEMVTSSMGGGIIEKLPKIGQIVKKGEMLVVFSQTGIDAEIAALEAKLEEAKEILKNKTLDKERADKLIEKAISKNEWEEASHSAICARLNIKEKEAELRKLEFDKTHCFIPAPYDCKVTKILLVPNSGTDIGQEILEVERIDSQK